MAEEEEEEFIDSAAEVPLPPPLVVRVGGAFSEGPRGLGVDDDEAAYYWRFVDESDVDAQRLDAVYLFRDVDTACAYLEAIWALLPGNKNIGEWFLVRTPLPRDFQVLPIQANLVPDTEGGLLLKAATMFMQVLRQSGLWSLYRDRSVAAATLPMMGWEPTTNAAASVWPLDISLVENFLFARPADEETEDVPTNPRHWSWRRRGNEARLAPTDVDYVLRLALYRPTLERHAPLKHLPPSLGVPGTKPLIVERYHYEPVAVPQNALGPARTALRLAEFSPARSSRPTLIDVESWFNQFLGEAGHAPEDLNKDAPDGVDLKTYRMTLAVIALAFGDPLGNAWFVCMPRLADDPTYRGGKRQLLYKEGNSEKDVTSECFARELMAVFGYVHSNAPMFVDWQAERRLGRLFPAVRLRNTEHRLRLEFPYTSLNGGHWDASRWCAQLVRLVVAQSSSNAQFVKIAVKGGKTTLQALPPIFRLTGDGLHWQEGLELAAQVVAEAYRQFYLTSGAASEVDAVKLFITSGLGEQAILSRPHLSRDVFFQESTWAGMISSAGNPPAYTALKETLAARYPPPAAAALPTDRLSDDISALLLKGIKELPSILSQGNDSQSSALLIQSKGRPRWAYVLPRDYSGTVEVWYETILKQGRLKTPAPHVQPGSGSASSPFAYSLTGSFLVESDFQAPWKSDVLERARGQPFFNVLNNILDDTSRFPNRTPWFLPFLEAERFRKLTVRLHELMLHPFNALLHRALASGNESFLGTLLGWRKNHRDDLFASPNEDDVLDAVSEPKASEEAQLVAAILFVAFMVGQRGSPEAMKESVAAAIFMPNGKPLLVTEWILYEALRIGDLDLLEMLLASNGRFVSDKAINFTRMLRDMQGVSRPLFLSEHFALLERRYRDSDIPTHARLRDIKPRLGIILSHVEPLNALRAPRTVLDINLDAAKILYESNRKLFASAASPYEPLIWSSDADYKIPTSMRARPSTTFFLRVQQLWLSASSANATLPPPPHPSDETFPLAARLSLAGHTWQRRNTLDVHVPDALLVLEAHWRSFINHITLAKDNQALMSPPPPPPPEQETFPNDGGGTPVFVEDDDSATKPGKEWDPFSPDSSEPPPPPSSYAADIPHTAPLPPFRTVIETTRQRQTRLFLDAVSKAADEPLPPGRKRLPIYTIEQAARLTKPSTPGFWLLPFYTSNLHDRAVSELLHLYERHLNARIAALTASTASIGALIASFGILVRRLDESQFENYRQQFASTGFNFDRLASSGRHVPTTFWSDLSTGTSILESRSQLVVMFKTMARERMRLLAMHPTRSKELIVPVLDVLFRNIVLPAPNSSSKSSGGVSAGTSVMNLISDAIKAAAAAGETNSDASFRPIHVRYEPPTTTQRLRQTIEPSSSDELEFVGVRQQPLEGTSSFEKDVDAAIALLRHMTLSPEPSARNAMSQIRRLAMVAFPRLASPAPRNRRVVDTTNKGARWVPDQFMGIVDASLRAAIEGVVNQHSANYLLLLLVNEPTSTPETPLPTLTTLASRYKQHVNQEAVARVARWLDEKKRSMMESDFGHTGNLGRQAADELIRPDLDLGLFFTLFGLLPGRDPWAARA